MRAKIAVMVKKLWNDQIYADQVLSGIRGSVFADRERLRTLDAFTTNLVNYIIALEDCIFHTYSIKNDFGIRTKGYLPEWEKAHLKSTIDGRDKNGDQI